MKVLEEGRANAWLKESVKHAIVDNLEDKPVLQLVSEMGFSKLTNELYESMLKMRNQGLTPSDIHKLVESETEKILGMLINRAYSMYNNKKAQQSFLDYEDILQRTFNLLVRNKKVLNECRRKFKFILIDEYQDLNFVQDKILRLLGEDNNFFVVGDKKQSIYGFRGARVELFEKLRRDLENRGQALNLKDNFRSDGRIVEYVNQKFKGLMKGYEPINAYRPSSSQKNIYFLTLESKGLMDERRRREGEFIARTILKMMTDDSVKIHDRETKEYRKPTFRDFSVLLRRRTHLKHYTKALKNYKIPFYVADAGSLMESTSVKHLLCALNTIEYGDDINLYGTLSHLFKISDNTLAEYVLKGQELILGLKEGAVDVKDSKSLTDAFQLIRKWCKMKERVTIRELAGKIIEETKLLSFAVKGIPLRQRVCLNF